MSSGFYEFVFTSAEQKLDQKWDRKHRHRKIIANSTVNVNKFKQFIEAQIEKLNVQPKNTF